MDQHITVISEDMSEAIDCAPEDHRIVRESDSWSGLLFLEACRNNMDCRKGVRFSLMSTTAMQGSDSSHEHIDTLSIQRARQSGELVLGMVYRENSLAAGCSRNVETGTRRVRRFHDVAHLMMIQEQEI